ncbi:hypothetical protein TNCV_2000801 [Trichonephila clavipes]|nr:hypothetical protein TNCV_2000801 [Trichonephila clavipes]
MPKTDSTTQLLEIERFIPPMNQFELICDPTLKCFAPPQPSSMIAFCNERLISYILFSGSTGSKHIPAMTLTFHFSIRKTTFEFGIFNSLDMFLKDRSFLWYTTITPFSKSDSSEFLGILQVTNVNAVSKTIFKYRVRDLYQNHR